MRQQTGCRPFRMATEQHSPEILSSGAGLAAAVAVETGGELGEFEPVRARGYWEQVWRRFRRDRVAIGGGLFIIFLFIAALASTVGDRLNNITLGFLGKGVVTLVLVLGFFGWFYPARIVRAQVLSLREKEFIEAARMVGASDARIVRSHLLPHLVAPIIVLASITVAQFVLLEAGLSFLGIGIKQPTASWGSLLATGPTYYLTQPWLMVWPGLAILFTTLAFNLLGDGLRDAFDPRSTH